MSNSDVFINYHTTSCGWLYADPTGEYEPKVRQVKITEPRSQGAKNVYLCNQKTSIQGDKKISSCPYNRNKSSEDKSNEM